MYALAMYRLAIAYYSLSREATLDLLHVPWYYVVQ